MRHFLMLSLCIAFLGSSVGCCWLHPYGGGCGYGGGCAGGACGTPSYYGGFPTGAYYGDTTMSAAIPASTSYALSPYVPVTAAVPVDAIPTY